MPIPFAQLKKNKRPIEGSLEGPMNRSAQREAEERMEAKDAPKPTLSRFHDLLQSHYRTEMTWPWLLKSEGGREYQMTVSEFYPAKSVVVDRFMTQDAVEEGDIVLKAILFKEHGIKYVAATPDKSFAELEAELGV